MIRLLQNWNGYGAGTLLNPEGADELIAQNIAEEIVSEKGSEDETPIIETVERPGFARVGRSRKTRG